MRWFWIDRFIEFESGRQAKAVKNISLAEDHLHDHFPGYPVMPNSLVVEGLAQTGGLLVCEHYDFKAKVVLAKVPKAKFHCEANPGDSLIYTAAIEYIQPDGAMVTATSHIGDRLQAEMELVFANLNSELGEKIMLNPQDLAQTLRVLHAFEVGRAADGSPLVEPAWLAGPGEPAKSHTL